MKYKCPWCGEESLKNEWEETEVGCELCGSHDALRCPRCKEDVDLIYSDLEGKDKAKANDYNLSIKYILR